MTFGTAHPLDIAAPIGPAAHNFAPYAFQASFIRCDEHRAHQRVSPTRFSLSPMAVAVVAMAGAARAVAVAAVAMTPVAVALVAVAGSSVHGGLLLPPRAPHAPLSAGERPTGTRCTGLGLLQALT